VKVPWATRHAVFPSACAGSTAATVVDESQHPDDVGGRNPEILRTGIHEGGHILTSRSLNLEVTGSTLIEGEGYSGLTWGPQSKRALRGKAAYDSDGNAAHDAVGLRIAFHGLCPVPASPATTSRMSFSSVNAGQPKVRRGGRPI
jgi:hypothetical protein